MNPERWEYVQATVYLSSGTQFVQKLNKPECNQRTFKSEGRVLREKITKSEHVTDESCRVLNKKNKDQKWAKYRTF